VAIKDKLRPQAGRDHQRRAGQGQVGVEVARKKEAQPFEGAFGLKKT